MISFFFATGKDLNELADLVNIEIESIVSWLNANKMSLNVDKTHFMVFKPSKKKVLSNIEIKINNSNILEVDNTKFLGVIIDSKLTWKDHITYVTNKIDKNIGVLIKCRKVFNEKTLITLYYSFIYPYLSYCIHVWGSTFKTYLKRVVTLQKRIVRIMCGAPRNSHTEKLYKELNMMNVNGIFMYNVGLFMYKHHHNLLPSIFDVFESNDNIHNYQTRQSHLLHIPYCRTDLGKRSFTYQAVSVWNKLCQNIDVDVSVGVFKKHSKEYLINTD